MASLSCMLCGKSLIGFIIRQEVLMRSILDVFMREADVHLSSMIDKLITAGVLQTKHVELITNMQTDRQHRVRKLWMLLMQCPPRAFREHVEPLLEELGWLLDQDRTDYLKSRMCLWCFMKGMLSLEEFADTLYENGCLKTADYRDAVKSNTLERFKWPVVFECLQREHANSEAVKICEDILRKYDIPVPKDMANILAHVKSCACNDKIDTASQDSPEGPFCKTCERIVNHPGGDTHTRRNRAVPTGNEASLIGAFQPEDDSDNVVDIRPRTCRNMRVTQMGKAHTFQKEVFQLKSHKDT